MTDPLATVTKRGRPPQGERAMTDQERKRAQRMRDRRAVIDAIGHETDAPLRALLALLGRVEASEPARQSGPTRLAGFRSALRIQHGHGMTTADRNDAGPSEGLDLAPATKAPRPRETALARKGVKRTAE